MVQDRFSLLGECVCVFISLPVDLVWVALLSSVNCGLFAGELMGDMKKPDMIYGVQVLLTKKTVCRFRTEDLALRSRLQVDMPDN